MYFRISALLCWALLVALTSAQNSQRTNTGFEFNGDAEIEGSGFGGEVNRDLESSGSGQGPPGEDDEDTDINTNVNSHSPDHVPPVVEINPKKDQSPGYQAPVNPAKDKVVPTEDTSVIMNPKTEDRPTSFFSQPGILAAVIGGAVVGLLCAILVVMFIVYRMRKKDEGSYALGEPKQSPNSNSYSRGTNKEFYA
ncbi:hypothetical protein ABEB36_011005 [Hypothenemus hampei]|uniref:Syndecan n=1 Tax=Hypothenemus hampei TaxID=57062 RepID=A0ABD1EE47_HYPHA